MTTASEANTELSENPGLKFLNAAAKETSVFEKAVTGYEDEGMVKDFDIRKINGISHHNLNLPKSPEINGASDGESDCETNNSSNAEDILNIDAVNDDSMRDSADNSSKSSQKLNYVAYLKNFQTCQKKACTSKDILNKSSSLISKRPTTISAEEIKKRKYLIKKQKVEANLQKAKELEEKLRKHSLFNLSSIEDYLKNGSNTKVFTPLEKTLYKIFIPSNEDTEKELEELKNLEEIDRKLKLNAKGNTNFMAELEFLSKFYNKTWLNDLSENNNEGEFVKNFNFKESKIFQDLILNQKKNNVGPLDPLTNYHKENNFSKLQSNDINEKNDNKNNKLFRNKKKQCYKNHFKIDEEDIKILNNNNIFFDFKNFTPEAHVKLKSLLVELKLKNKREAEELRKVKEKQERLRLTKKEEELKKLELEKLLKEDEDNLDYLNLVYDLDEDVSEGENEQKSSSELEPHSEEKLNLTLKAESSGKNCYAIRNYSLNNLNESITETQEKFKFDKTFANELRSFTNNSKSESTCSDNCKKLKSIGFSDLKKNFNPLIEKIKFKRKSLILNSTEVGSCSSSNVTVDSNLSHKIKYHQFLLTIKSRKKQSSNLNKNQNIKMQKASKFEEFKFRENLKEFENLVFMKSNEGKNKVFSSRNNKIMEASISKVSLCRTALNKEDTMNMVLSKHIVDKDSDFQYYKKKRQVFSRPKMENNANLNQFSSKILWKSKNGQHRSGVDRATPLNEKEVLKKLNNFIEFQKKVDMKDTILNAKSNLKYHSIKDGMHFRSNSKRKKNDLNFPLSLSKSLLLMKC